MRHSELPRERHSATVRRTCLRVRPASNDRARKMLNAGPLTDLLRQSGADSSADSRLVVSQVLQTIATPLSVDGEIVRAYLIGKNKPGTFF